MFGSRPGVSDVFTPRRTEVNREIYVDRPDLEKELRRSIQGALHSIVFGESGSGKSWLYKKVLADMGAETATLNCANAARWGSLTKELENLVSEERPKRLTKMEESMDAKIKAVIAEGGLVSKRQYEFAMADPLIECFEMLRETAGDRPAVLVVDNLEMIFDSSDLMKELASIIILLDDARYSKFEIKLLIVGVPSGARDYLSKSQASVGNRISEMSEVSSLTRSEVDSLVEKGFVELLKIPLTEQVLTAWQAHVMEVTLGFAQHVQEYCEQLGFTLEDADWAASPSQLAEADARWLKKGLSQVAGTVNLLMNERDTKIGRRNQVLFALGKVNKKTFHVAEVEVLVREAFPTSTADKSLAVGQLLSELTGGENPMIKRSAKGPTYEFRDARFAMALRVFLQKDPQREKVTRLEQ